MIDIFPFAGYPVALYGLDEAGLFTARALFAGEAELSAWDDDPANREQATEDGIEPKDFTSSDLREFTSLIVSAHAWDKDDHAKKLATRARELNIEVICDVELLARTQREANYVGVSGAGGKSLTAALITYLLQVTGREAEMAGLSNTSALNTDPMGMEGTYVVEMTPFRVAHTVSITFDVAVLLNIGDDASPEAAMQIFHRQTDPRAAIIGIDDSLSQGVFNKLTKSGEQRVYPFSTLQSVAGGVFMKDGTLFDSFDPGEPVPVMDLSAIPQFAGPHAQANVAAAFATVRAIGVQPHAAMAAINSFPGLVDHREELGKIDGVHYINDAASTSLACVASSLCGYENIHWIARPGMEADIDAIEALKAVSGRIKAGYLFGESGPGSLGELEGIFPISRFASLEQALQAARKDALNEGAKSVVIFGPGSPFQNGEPFRQLVEALPGQRDDEDE